MGAIRKGLEYLGITGPIKTTFPQFDQSSYRLRGPLQLLRNQSFLDKISQQRQKVKQGFAPLHSLNH